MDIYGIITIVLGAFGSGGVLYLIISHMLTKSKFTAEVTAIEKTTNASAQDADLKVSVQVRELYNSILSDLRAEMDKKIAEERRLRVEQETGCDRKIAKLNREIHELSQRIKVAENNCGQGCFANKTP